MRSVQQLFSLKGKTAIVTGGSRGLGLQMAEALGEQGARIVISARKHDELDEAVAQLSARGIEASAIAVDLAAEAQVLPFAEEALRRLGQVDILVNNAGTTWGAPAEDYPLAAWDKVMDLNVRSMFLLTQAIGKLSMIPRRYGRVVNISSIAGLFGNPPSTMQTLAYNTSKGAVVNFTRALAAEWGRYGITVNSIAPGFFRSRMTKGVIAAYGEDGLSKDAPLQRIGDEEDLKGAVVLFASDAGKHITGQVLAVDGGVTAV